MVAVLIFNMSTSYAAQWVDVVKKNSKPNPLSGANLVHLGKGCVLRNQLNSNFQNQQAVTRTRMSVFNGMKPLFPLSSIRPLKALLALTLHSCIHRSIAVILAQSAIPLVLLVRLVVVLAITLEIAISRLDPRVSTF